MPRTHLVEMFINQEIVANCTELITKLGAVPVSFRRDLTKEAAKREYAAMILRQQGLDVEYLSVTEWLAKRLEAVGEYVYTNFDDNYIWPRKNRDLKLSEDPVVLKIYRKYAKSRLFTTWKVLWGDA